MKLLSSFLLIFSPLVIAIRRHSPELHNQEGSVTRDDIARRRVESDQREAITKDILGPLLERQYRHLSSESNRNNLPTPDDHQVTSLPYLDPKIFPTKHYAGHLPASAEDDKKLFYWLFEPETVDEDTPLLIWLNGGPGCSSMDGLFLENGPFHLVSPSKSGKDDWSIEVNPHSWHKAPAYTLYIDQPVGTGLSFSKKKKWCKNDLEVDIDFHYFLMSFLHVYEDMFLSATGDITVGHGDKQMNQRTMSRPLYFSGESHAGHYIPSMMDYILQRNDDTNPETAPPVKISLAGAAIGNGWMDPFYQYAGAEAAYGAGLIDLAQKEDFDHDEKRCRELLNGKNYRSGICFDLLDDIIDQSYGISSPYRVSLYDNRIIEYKGKPRTFPEGYRNVERYLGGWTGNSYPSDMQVNYKDVLKALHAEESIAAGQKYEECTDPPYNALSHQDGLGVTDEIVRILEHPDEPKLFFFNGMNDLICNHVGNEKALDNLSWKHAKEWTVAKRYAWNVESDSKLNGNPTAGFMKEYRNLMFLKVMDSGHMVPMDLPSIALEMMQTFLSSGSFKSSKQNLGSKVPGSESSCGVCPACDVSHVLDVNKHLDPSNQEGKNDQLDEQQPSKVYIGIGFLCGCLFVCFVKSTCNFLKRNSEEIGVPNDDFEFEMGNNRRDPYSDSLESRSLT